MAENENGTEKTEKATPKKRNDERKKGHVMKSQDVCIVASLFASFSALRITGPLIFVRLQEFMNRFIGSAGSGIGDVSHMDMESFIRRLLLDVFGNIILCSGILLFVSSMIAILSTGIQTKFLVSWKRLKFNLGKMNPIKGIKNLLSLKKLFELAKNLLKFIVLFAIVYNEITKRIVDIVRLIDMEPVRGMLYIARSIFSIVITIGIAFIAIAVIDYMYQWYTFEKDMMMTKQEVKDEFKQLEGDPKIKSKRRNVQMQMAMQRMMQSIPEADVVIRNPTHYAVALKYDPDKASAPLVLAKGKDKAALRIVEIAAEAGVPDVENKPLARALYDKTEVGREILPEFYQGVADVLWFVYNLKNKPIPDSRKNTY